MYLQAMLGNPQDDVDRAQFKNYVLEVAGGGRVV
jgi:hypothetical protein